MFVFVCRPNGGIRADDFRELPATIDSTALQQWIAPDGTIGVVWSKGLCFTRQGGVQPHMNQPFVLAQGRLDAPDEIRRLENISGTASDAQLIAACVLRAGERAPSVLRGDFAVAHWTGKALFIATDHVGQESLYHTQTAQGFAVATGLPLLLALPDTPRALNASGLALLVTGRLGNVKGQTAFAQIHLLPGGHGRWLSAGRQSEMHRWWRPDSTIRHVYRDPRDYTADLSELFTAAVRCRLPANGPVGCMLSGGLDSTLVAGFAAPILAESGRILHAWTSVPHPRLTPQEWTGWESSDWGYAREMGAQHPNVRNHAVSPEGICLLDVLQSIHRTSLTPVRNSANHLWITEIGARARQTGCEVVLNGVRGNAGISFTGSGGLGRLIRRGKWARAVAHARRMPGHRPHRWIAHVIPAVAGEMTWQHVKRLAGKNPSVIPGEVLLTRAVRRLYGRQEPDLHQFNRRRDWLDFLCLPRSAFAINLRDYAGVSQRDPTGDRRLCEYLLGCPPEAFIADGFERVQARLLGAGRVPDSIRWRRTRGAQVPEAPGFFALHAERYRSAWQEVRRLAWTREYIDVPQADRVLEELIQGKPQPTLTTNAFFRVLDIGLFINHVEQRRGGR